MNFLSQFFRFITAPFRFLFSLPMAVISAPRRLMGLSLPARVALLTAILLIVCAVVAFLSVWLTEDEADTWNYWMRWGTLIALALLFVIPVVVYYAVKSWLEGEISRYPDIDQAWQEGLQALAANGLDLAEMPVFLVLGAADERSTRALFEASGLDYVVRHVPPGRKPLHWYGDENGVYLVVRDASHLSRLNSLAGAGAAAAVPMGGDVHGTAQTPGTAHGTLAAGGIRDSGAFLHAAAEDVGEPDFGGGGGIQGTLVPGAAPADYASGARPATPATTASLGRREAEEQIERLRYVCSLLVHARQPMCPMNGILTLLPLHAVSDVMLAKDMPGAVQNDLTAIRQTTKLCCPITAMVTGMETESGFTELVRRVGTGRAKTNRFGKGFNVWNPPTAENIDAFSAHACGSFEDWVYSLFREPDGLNKPGNAKLYSLLCKIRSQLRSRLRNILLHGYSTETGDEQAEQAPLLFSGCYFAATGKTGDRQAFVKNVFEKMLDMEEELDWTDDALIEDDRYHALARMGMGVSGLLVLGIIAMFVYKFYFQGG